jgi:tetratricopeptide (TPR) repeat protein
MKRAAAAIACSLAFGCDDAREPRPPEPTLPLEVLWGGCAEVRRGPICELGDDRTVVAWIDVERRTPLHVAIDGRDTGAARATVEGGEQLRIDIPAGARELRISSDTGVFSLPLADFHIEPDLLEARRARARGELDRAAELVRSHLASTDPGTRARAMGIEARIALSRGDIDTALAGLERSSAAAAEAGLLVTSATDAFGRADTLRAHRFDLVGAGETLARVQPHTTAAPALRVPWAYYEASRAWDVGDVRGALAGFDRAILDGRRMGEDEYGRDARSLRALVWVDLGRASDALAEMDRLAAETPDDDPCGRASLLNNRGWIGIMEADRGRMVGIDSDSLAAAMDLWTGDCDDQARAQNTELNRAIAAIITSDLPTARAAIDRARGLGPMPAEMASWSIDVDGRVALASGRAREALSLYDEMRSRAAVAAPANVRWRAEVGRGRSLRALGRVRDARDAFAAAETILDEDIREVPAGEGQSSFAASRDASARALVDVSIELGDTRGAMNAARHARRRALTRWIRGDRIAALAPDARAQFEEALGEYRRARADIDAIDAGAWTAADAELEERARSTAGSRQAMRESLDRAYAVLGGAGRDETLRAPDPGELVVALHPLPSGWAVLVEDDRGVAAYRDNLAAGSPEAIASSALEAIAARLANARAVRFLVPGELAGVDLGSMPVGGTVLIDHAIVTWGIDLPVAPAARGAAAVVVADPRSDLAAAAREGAALADVLEPAGPVQRLFQEGATRSSLLDALDGARLFYYAGHGVARGRDGLESALPLAGADLLEVADVLAIDRAPERVVLLGCATAGEQATSVAGLGLAQAFVAAGSRSVIATSRPVDDEAAARFGRALALTGDAFDAAHARAAIVRLRQDTPSNDDWKSLRVLVP